MENTLKGFLRVAVATLLSTSAMAAVAAQLNTDARNSIPREVQQLVVIDYKAMQNSEAAMALRERVMPPELKVFDEALRKSGLNDENDVEQLAFALFRTGSSAEELQTVGVAQGQFPVQQMMLKFRRVKVKPTLVRTNKIYPMGRTGMVLSFVDPSTMVFGSIESVTKALDARDGVSGSLLNNSTMLDAMKSVDWEPLWSILDAKGTQIMMRQVLGEAGSLTDFETVRKRLQSSWYAMNFQHGVKFNLTIQTGDTFAAATISSLLNAAVVVRRMSSSEIEKAALAETDISSDAGKLGVHFACTDDEFNGLLKSPLFQSMVR